MSESQRSFHDPESPNFLDVHEVTERYNWRMERFSTQPQMLPEKELALTMSEVRRLPEGVAKEDLSDLRQRGHEIEVLEKQLKILKQYRADSVKKLHGQGMSLTWLAERSGLTRQGVSSIVAPKKKG